jgi:hypothetical protein
MNGRFILGLLLVLVLIALAVSIGVYAYNIGVAQGLTDSGKLTTPYPYPFYGPFFVHPFGFGFLGFLGPLFLFLIFFALLRGLFWGRHWGRYPGRWGDQVPPAVEEWHRKMHETK